MVEEYTIYLHDVLDMCTDRNGNTFMKLFLSFEKLEKPQYQVCVFEIKGKMETAMSSLSTVAAYSGICQKLPVFFKIFIEWLVERRTELFIVWFSLVELQVDVEVKEEEYQDGETIATRVKKQMVTGPHKGRCQRLEKKVKEMNTSLFVI